MSGVVLDSSFIIAVLVEEEHSDFARAIMLQLDGDSMMAPGLLAWEIVNVLQKKVRQKRLTLAQRAVMLSRFESLAITLQPTPEAGELGFLIDLCDRHGLTGYDAAYLLLALDEGVALASLDDDLVAAARAEGLTVHSPF